MAVRAKDDVDPRDRAYQGKVVVEVLMTDEDDGGDVLHVTQRSHDFARGSHAIGKGESRPFDERREIGAGDREDSDPNPVPGEDVVTLKPLRIRTQDRELYQGPATGEFRRTVIGVVIAQCHGIDDAVHPGPLSTPVFVRPRW